MNSSCCRPCRYTHPVEAGRLLPDTLVRRATSVFGRLAAVDGWRSPVRTALGWCAVCRVLAGRSRRNFRTVRSVDWNVDSVGRLDTRHQGLHADTADYSVRTAGPGRGGRQPGERQPVGPLRRREDHVAVPTTA